jgi:hypothetical protein
MSLDRIIDKLRQWGRPWTAGGEPLELHRAVLEDIEAQVVAVGGGRRVFPADRVEVRLLADTPEEEARLEAIVQSGWDLAREARERLAASGARVPEGLAIDVVVTRQGGPDFGGRRYCLVFRKAAPAAGGGGPTAAAAPATGGGSQAAATALASARPAAPEPVNALAGAPHDPEAAAGAGVAEAAAEPGTARQAPAIPAAPGVGSSPGGRAPVLHLAVLKGTAARASYDLTGERIYLGRLEEVLDTAGRVKRRNDVAFREEGDLNQTVSREHARIAWDAESKAFWLRDEGSASGTMLFRAGRSIEVSRHDRRGVRLENGDEIYLGRAVLKVEL